MLQLLLLCCRHSIIIFYFCSRRTPPVFNGQRWCFCFFSFSTFHHYYFLWMFFFVSVSVVFFSFSFLSTLSCVHVHSLLFWVHWYGNINDVMDIEHSIFYLSNIFTFQFRSIDEIIIDEMMKNRKKMNPIISHISYIMIIGQQTLHLLPECCFFSPFFVLSSKFCRARFVYRLFFFFGCLATFSGTKR